jgi:predicted Rossmann-fold nucleotide-binding protein
MENTLKLTIGIIGPTESFDASTDTLEKSKIIGGLLAHKDVVLATTADSGVALWVCEGAKEGGIEVIGFSPASSKKEHVEMYGLSTSYIDSIVYTGFGLLGRDILMIRSTDAVIIHLGKKLAVYEITAAVREGKPIAILHDDTEDHKKKIDEIRSYGDETKIVSSSEPEELIEKLFILL